MNLIGFKYKYRVFIGSHYLLLVAKNTKIAEVRTNPHPTGGLRLGSTCQQH